MKGKAALIGLLALAGSVALMPGAAAMPNGLPQAHQLSGSAPNTEQVRRVCNPWGRCWWRPTFYGAYAHYSAPPAYYFGRPRWHRHWRYGW
jgi:hypothetical protein